MKSTSKTKQFVLATPLLLLIGAAVIAIGLHFLRDNEYQAAQKAVAKRDFRRAGELLKRWLLTRPNDRDALLLAAQAARRNGDLERAEYFLSECDRLGERSETLALEHRLLRLRQRNLSAADALLNTCLNNPEAPATALTLEVILDESVQAALASRKGWPDVKKVQRGIALWLEHYPSKFAQVQGLVWRGQLADFLGDHKSAVADFRQALQLDADHTDARYQLALAIVEEQPTEAADHLRKLHERDPDNIHISFPLATVLRGLGQLEESRKLLDVILVTSRDHVSALIERAQIDLDQGQADLAEPRLRRAITLAPRQPEVYLAMSRCHQLAGRAVEAKVCQDQFLQFEAERRRKQEQQEK